MQWFYNLKIKRKLMLGFGTVSAISMLIGIIGLFIINSMNNEDEKLYNKITFPLGELFRMNDAFQRIRIGFRDMIHENDPEKINKIIGQRKELSQEITRTSEAYKNTLVTEEGHKKYKEFAKTERNSSRESWNLNSWQCRIATRKRMNISPLPANWPTLLTAKLH